MRSEYRQWGDEMRVSFAVPGGQAHVLYSLFAGERVENDDGSWTPKEFTYVEFPTKSELPYFVMECDHGANLAPRIVAFQVIAQASTRDVRSVDLRRARLEDALELAWTRVTHWPAVVSDVVPAQSMKAELARQPSRRVLRGLRAQGRRKVTDDVHNEVARVYREHLKTGAPTKAVADYFQVQPSTASLYVKRAREAGVLEPRIPSENQRTDSASRASRATADKERT
jgi:hypothetical protein